jgi:hypothetical protein
MTSSTQGFVKWHTSDDAHKAVLSHYYDRPSGSVPQEAQEAQVQNFLYFQFLPLGASAIAMVCPYSAYSNEIIIYNAAAFSFSLD